MIDDKRERRTALWWIEHESTNEFWSLRNPWVVGPPCPPCRYCALCAGDVFLGYAPRRC